MGSKGRDLILLLIFVITAVSILFWLININLSSLFWVLVILTLYLLWFYVVQIPQAQKNSKAKGLKVLVLLPLYFQWVKILVNVSGKKIKMLKGPAYEIHVNTASKELNNFIKELERDLKIVKANYSGIFIWETSAPVPSSFRKMIRDYEKAGYAFWLKGGWPFPPRMPFVGKELRNGTVRRGAIIYMKGEEK